MADTLSLIDRISTPFSATLPTKLASSLTLMAPPIAPPAGFSDNSSVPLVIWCSSEEMDLGGRALQEHDDFNWIMRPSFWSGNNEMECTMKWDTIRRSFDAFMASRDTHRCGAYRMCYWMVTQDGFFFSNDQVNWTMDFLW